MAAMADLEHKLQTIFTTKVPALPHKALQTIRRNIHWIALVLAIFAAWDAFNLWRWAKWSSDSVDYANSLIAVYGGAPITTNRWTVFVVLALVVLIVQAVLFFRSYRAYSAGKDGWRNMYYGTLLYGVYGVIILFSDYADLGNLFGNLLFSTIVLYVLFQVRDIPTHIVAVAKQKLDKPRPRKPATKA